MELLAGAQQISGIARRLPFLLVRKVMCSEEAPICFTAAGRGLQQRLRVRITGRQKPPPVTGVNGTEHCSLG